MVDTSPLVYGSGVQGFTSLTAHLGIESTAAYTSLLGTPFGVRLRNQGVNQDAFGVMMPTTIAAFPLNGLAIMSMPYAIGSSFGSMFNTGTYTVTDATYGTTTMVVTTDASYVPQVFFAVPEPSSVAAAGVGGAVICLLWRRLRTNRRPGPKPPIGAG